MPKPPVINRRRYCMLLAGGALGLTAGRAVPAEERAPLGISGPRLVILDWGLAATGLALGTTPIGVPAPDWYDRYIVAPPMPAGVTDVGLLFTPNFELIEALEPDAIVITPSLTPAMELLGRIAPVERFAIHAPGPDAYDHAARETARLAAFLGDAAAGSAYIGGVERTLNQTRVDLAALSEHPIYLVSPIDDRHLTIYGPNSFHAAVLKKLGLRNAWTGMPPAGFATIALQELAVVPEARIVVIRNPAEAGVVSRLLDGPFWSALPFARAGRVSVIDTVLVTGGLPAAARLARMLRVLTKNAGGGA